MKEIRDECSINSDVIPQRVVSAVLRELNQEQIEDAVACFTKDIRYKDHGIGLEFKDKERLAEFFQKAQELYPDSLRQTHTTFVSGDHVITEWTLKATLTEPCFTADSHDRFQCRRTGPPSCGQTTGRLPTGRTITTD